MRTLALGISAEGNTDVRFFTPLLVRVATDLLRTKAHHPAQIADVEVLPGRPSHETSREVLSSYARSLDVLVVHADANGDVQRAIDERIQPLFELARGMFPEKPELVELVPSRETEAWMLCDFQALRDVLGTQKRRRDLGLPAHVREVENITDPKAVLKEAQQLALGMRQARKVGLAPLYAALGQAVSLDQLIRLSAFVRFADAFESALRHLGFLPTTR